MQRAYAAFFTSQALAQFTDTRARCIEKPCRGAISKKTRGNWRSDLIAGASAKTFRVFGNPKRLGPRNLFVKN
ncbi:MAG: hypothetical protein HDKAJFGB_02362 [Anaerolineae bacterium]|nr:hypothetical protein [Anaerolineae bacterium]